MLLYLLAAFSTGLLVGAGAVFYSTARFLEPLVLYELERELEREAPGAYEVEL